MTTLPPNTDVSSPPDTDIPTPRAAEMDPDEIAEPSHARAPAPARPEVSAATRPAALTKPGLAVHLRGLRAFYGEAEQVKGVDLEFRANEVTAIIGPSGCGKSTMVRCINRMHEEIPGRLRRGQGAARRLRRLRPVGRRRRRAPCDRDGLPEAQPLSRRCQCSTTSPPACA